MSLKIYVSNYKLKNNSQVREFIVIMEVNLKIENLLISIMNVVSNTNSQHLRLPNKMG